MLKIVRCIEKMGNSPSDLYVWSYFKVKCFTVSIMVFLRDRSEWETNARFFFFTLILAFLIPLKTKRKENKGTCEEYEE